MKLKFCVPAYTTYKAYRSEDIIIDIENLSKKYKFFKIEFTNKLKRKINKLLKAEKIICMLKQGFT